MSGSRLAVRATCVALGVAALGLVLVAWPQSLGGRIGYVRVDGWSMNPTLHNGDLAVVQRQSAYRVGQAVAYRIPSDEFGGGAIVIHRLVGGDGKRGFVTRGDNRTIDDPWHPRTSNVVGLIRFDVPGAGSWFATASKPVWIGALVSLTTVFVMVLPRSSRGRRRAAPKTLREPSRELPTADLSVAHEVGVS